MAVEAGRTAGGRDEGARYSIDERPAPTVTPIVFVGGTGRSGTHVVARLLGRNGKLAMIPVECRFHVEMRGFPGLLAGRVRKSHFLRRLHGFWWKGFQNGRQRGLFRFVDPRDFTAAVASFDLHFEAAPEEACRQLFLDLLWPRAVTKGASGIVEQSCDVVARAPTLLRLFPEARFVHVVRDGRDASASRVAQTRGLIPPRNRVKGLEWWEERLARVDRGARAIPPERLLQVGLEDLLTPPRRPPAVELARFAGVRLGSKMRRFLWGQMTVEAASTGRWREGISADEQARIDGLYHAALDRLEAQGVSTVPILRRALEREAG